MANDLVFGVFMVGGVEIGIPASVLQQVLDWPARFVAQANAPDHGLGMIELRGTAVPAVDLRRLLQVGAEPSGGRIVVLRMAAGRLGLAVDSIVDIVRVAPDALQQVGTGADGERPLIASVIARHDRVIQILDMNRLIGRPGVVLLPEPMPSAGSIASGGIGVPFLFFDCDDSRFCLEASCVREVINHPELEKACDVGALYLGLLRLRGAVIPVVDLFRLLGLDGTGQKKARLLVLDVAGRVVAVPISDVVAIRRLRVADIVPMSGFGLRRPALFGGIVVGDAAGGDAPAQPADAILIDHLAMMQDRDVLALGRLHDGLDAHQEPGERRTAGGHRTAYLGFEAGATYSVDLSQVEEIMEMPACFMRLGSPDGIVLGLVRRRGAMIPLIDFRRLAGQGSIPPTDATRVLVVGSGLSKFGLVVDTTTSVDHVSVCKTLTLPITIADALRGFGTMLLVDGVGGRHSKLVLDLAGLVDHLDHQSVAA